MHTEPPPLSKTETDRFPDRHRTLQAALHDCRIPPSSVIQYQDLIGMHDRGCSLRYQKYGHIFRILGQCFSKCRICSEIKRRCTVIQNQYLWIFHQCSCDRQPLSLPSRQVFPPSLTGAFSLPGFSSTNSKACAVFNAAYISCSDACSFPI